MIRAVLLAAALAVGVLFAGAGPASAHVQMQPTSAAPDDLVQFTVLVPGERDIGTTKVELKVPAGVLPFSYEDAPGWKRSLVLAPDKSVDRIVWTGELAADGFARFSFLAATPEQPGTLTWKALQTYADGQVVRWIGAPDAEEPAATTVISASVPRQNAGGEGEEASPATADSSGGDSSSDRDPVAVAALIVAVVAVGVGAAALVAARRRPQV